MTIRDNNDLPTKALQFDGLTALETLALIREQVEALERKLAVALRGSDA